MPNSHKNISIIDLKTWPLSVFTDSCTHLKTVVTKSSEQLATPKYAELKSQYVSLKSQLCDAELQKLPENFLIYKVANVLLPTVIS